MSKKREGLCHLCGEYTKLSYEHIPPKSAFNTEEQTFQTLADIVTNRSHSKFRQGIGYYRLCESCNNRTGAWYGTAYAKWARQGLALLERVGRTSGEIQLPFNIMPLNIIKQVAVMTVASSSAPDARGQQELRHFALNREAQYLPPDLKVYVYFNIGGNPRLAADGVVVNVKTNRGAVVLAEMAFPPFGYAVCHPMRGKQPMGEYWRLCDISWFSQFGYNVWTNVFLPIPSYETHYPFPMDYRTKEEIVDSATGDLD